MPRIAGVDVPNEKRIEIALTYIHGIGRTRANEVLKATGINPDLRSKKLTGTQVQNLARQIGKIATEGDLKKQTRENIQRLKRTGSYRGLRHMMRLPVRGQRTRTNARSNRGRRQTVGAMTKEMRQKLETK